MTRVGKIAVCLAGGLALSAGLHAAGVASTEVSTSNPVPDSPYAPIVVRNVFALIPPPPPDTNPPEPPKNLPKITPTGIQSFFGHVKVLFKASGVAAKPGQPARDAYYILSQGQRQDDIEVIKIDQKNSIVTFDNHGTQQELPLVNSPSSGGTPAATSPPAGTRDSAPRTPVARVNSGSPGIIRYSGGSGTRSSGTGIGANNPGGGPNGGAANGVLNFGASTQGRTYQPEPSNLTPEQTAIMIEIQRAQLMNSPHPAYPPALLPPTPLTELNTSGSSP